MHRFLKQLTLRESPPPQAQEVVRSCENANLLRKLSACDNDHKLIPYSVAEEGERLQHANFECKTNFDNTKTRIFLHISLVPNDKKTTNSIKQESCYESRIITNSMQNSGMLVKSKWGMIIIIRKGPEGKFQLLKKRASSPQYIPSAKFSSK